jgi:hypothetical protein
LMAYLIQSQLSARLKYKSLYEAQVEGRAASPARYVDHIRVALELLQQHRLPGPVNIGHLNLVTLLDSGVSLKLSGGRELSIGMVPPESVLHGQTVKALTDLGGQQPVEVVAILRDGNVVMPEPDTPLQEGDRLLILASRNAREILKQHLAEGGGKLERPTGHPPGGPGASTV